MKIIITNVKASFLNAKTETGERVFATIANIANKPVNNGGKLIAIQNNNLLDSIQVGQELWASKIVDNRVAGKDKVALLITQMPTPVKSVVSHEKPIFHCTVNEASIDDITLEKELYEISRKDHTHKHANTAKVNAKEELISFDDDYDKNSFCNTKNNKYVKKANKICKEKCKEKGGSKKWDCYFDYESDYKW